MHRARNTLCNPWMVFHFLGLDKEHPGFPKVEKEEDIEAIYRYDPTQNLLLALLPPPPHLTVARDPQVMFLWSLALYKHPSVRTSPHHTRIPNAGLQNPQRPAACPGHAFLCLRLSFPKTTGRGERC